MGDANWGGAAAFEPSDGFAADGGFTPDTNFKSMNISDSHAENGDDAFTGEFKKENVSMHDGKPHDGGCRHCSSEHHFSRDCPEAPTNSGECYNCGEIGHNKADCTNPRVEREFTGTCRICEQAGHRAADCPQRPPPTCKICNEEGHEHTECSQNRFFAAMGVTDDVDADTAWKMLVDADAEKDLHDIKTALLLFAKAKQPEFTLQDMEIMLRANEMNTHLIAKEQTPAVTYTIVNFQGEPDQKFVVSFRFSAKPRRAQQDVGWPETPEENIERLGEAGFMLDSFVKVCSNCSEPGHTRAKCTQDKREPEKIIDECANCSEVGHRARDCTKARKVPGAGKECRNCGETGHMSRDCPNKEEQKCRNCEQPGHQAKECPEPKNMKNVTCRNCDERGHLSKECPKPTDWSRVKCSNCEEMGHSYKRCKAPPKAEEEAEGDGGW